MIQYAAPFMALADVTEYWVPAFARHDNR